MPRYRTDTAQFSCLVQHSDRKYSRSIVNPPIRPRLMALYKCALIDWLIEPYNPGAHTGHMGTMSSPEISCTTGSTWLLSQKHVHWSRLMNVGSINPTWTHPRLVVMTANKLTSVANVSMPNANILSILFYSRSCTNFQFVNCDITALKCQNFAILWHFVVV